MGAGGGQREEGLSEATARQAVEAVWRIESARRAIASLSGASVRSLSGSGTSWSSLRVFVASLIYSVLSASAPFESRLSVAGLNMTGP